MTRLTGLDGAFLALESPTTHLHILGAMVFDPTGVPGGVGFRRIRSLVDDRLPLVPPFRQRLVEAPFGLQHPTLVEDPDFDLDYHVRRTGLPRPGGLPELAELVADLASRPLDRTRPLWEFHVVEGMADGRIAIVAKVHHAIIDGVSGAELLASFFDLSPDPRPRPLFGSARGTAVPLTDSPVSDVAAAADGWAPPEIPGDLDQLRSSVGQLPGQLDGLARSVVRTVQTVRSLGGRQWDRGTVHSPAPFDAPQTSINRAISPHRRVAFAELSRAGVRDVAQAFGATTNDVVLAVAAGGLRTLFAGRQEAPETSLVAFVPVSVRTEAEQGALGNRVSGMFVSLATGVEDPAARLRCIRDGTRVAKEKLDVVAPDLFSSWAEAAFPAVATRLSRLVSRVRLFDHLAPPCNVVISNVPGPVAPLFLAGARMESLHPLGPIMEGVGVNATVFSYLDTIHVGIQACWDLVPDITVLAEGMEASLDELLVEADRRRRPVPWWHAELPA